MRILTRIGRLKLSVKILLALSSVIAAMIGSAAYVTSIGVDDLTHQAGNERITEEVSVIQAQITAVEAQLVRDTQYLAQNLAFNQAVVSGDLQAIQTSLLLDEATAQSSIDHVLVVDAAGIPLVVLQDRKVATTLGVLPDDLLSLALLGIPVSGVTWGEYPVLVAAAPVQANTGDIVGAVQTGLRLDDEFLSIVNFARAGVHLILTDHTGNIVAVFIDGRLGHSDDMETLLSGNNREVTTSPDQRLSHYGVALDRSAIQTALNGEVVYQSEFISNAAGQPLIAATIPLTFNYETEGALVILVELDTLASFSDKLISQQVFALILIGLASALVLALMAWYWIARPLENLQLATVQLAAGDYLHRAEVQSLDEVGQLGAAFNTMAQKLQERDQQIAAEITERAKIEQALRDAKDDLEQRVAERTQALQDELARRKQAEQQIRRALKEKEVLLKEIHHRVKNNMQVMSSLLRLQAEYASEADTVDVLQESQHRVHSMALVHERLYQSSDLVGIPAVAYIQDLVNNLVKVYRGDADQVAVELQIDDLTLDIDTAIPCGLILNELVSNALKHAFPDGQRGAIHIEVQAHAGQLAGMVVRDTGIGMPAEVDITQTKSLGLQLVANLSRQLGGELEIKRQQGTAICIHINP